MRKIIIVPAFGFISWDGGVDYLKLQIKYLIRLKEQNKIDDVILFLPELSPFGNFKRIIKNSIKHVISRPLERNQIFRHVLFEKDDEINRKIKIKKYCCDKVSGKKSIRNYIRQYENAIIFPVSEPLKALSCDQIGYIPDLQHLHLQHFFKKRERIARDASFKNILNNCDVVVVNSLDTKLDLENNYPKETSRSVIFATPFLPVADKNILTCTVDISAYNLPEKYFIISSQLWIHKDHITAFKALNILHERGYREIHIVCTGSVKDYRFPYYFDNIKEFIKKSNLEQYIHFLGFIPKEEQVAIMKKSISLVQPTLFEGGPGGGATYDAISYGVRAIVSDIGINKEIKHKSVYFFEKQNANDLSNVMETIMNTIPEMPTLDELLSQRKKNINEGAQFLADVFLSSRVVNMKNQTWKK